MHLPLNQINKKVFEKNIDLCISETLRLDESYQFLLTNISVLMPGGRYGKHITHGR